MLTDKLASALDTIFYALELPPEIQDLWAAPENRELLITRARSFIRHQEKLIDPRKPTQEKRGVPPLPRPTVVVGHLRNRR